MIEILMKTLREIGTDAKRALALFERLVAAVEKVAANSDRVAAASECIYEEMLDAGSEGDDPCSLEGDEDLEVRVVTTADAGSESWKRPREGVRWGARGVVVERDDSGGTTTYLVQYEDGDTAWYEPRELRLED